MPVVLFISIPRGRWLLLALRQPQPRGGGGRFIVVTLCHPQHFLPNVAGVGSLSDPVESNGELVMRAVMPRIDAKHGAERARGARVVPCSKLRDPASHHGPLCVGGNLFDIRRSA